MFKNCIIKKQKYIADLKSQFGKNNFITLDDLRYFFREKEPSLPNATINWRIHDLVSDGVISRSGRGKYQLGAHKIYQPELPARVLKVSKFLRKQFPLINYCVWDTGLLNEFAQHLSSYHFILVDVERDVAESAYYRLKEEFSGVFLQPSESLLNNVLPDFRLPLVIRNLITESPLGERENLPVITIEKMLVDIYCDSEFLFLAGGELRAIYQNAYYKYTINDNRLMRYADRKGRKFELQKYISEGGFKTQHSNP
ncbi:MAG TPA: DUF6577 family protein [Emticicia sp.]